MADFAFPLKLLCLSKESMAIFCIFCSAQWFLPPLNVIQYERRDLWWKLFHNFGKARKQNTWGRLRSTIAHRNVPTQTKSRLQVVKVCADGLSGFLIRRTSVERLWKCKKTNTDDGEAFLTVEDKMECEKTGCVTLWEAFLLENNSPMYASVKITQTAILLAYNTASSFREREHRLFQVHTSQEQCLEIR